MDWMELSNRLMDGAKAYKAFENGANAASMLGGLERARIELQAQYDELVARITQAQVDLHDAQDEIVRTRETATRALAKQQADFEAAQAQRVSAAQIELDGWTTKINEQAQAHQRQAQWYQDQITQWEGALSKLQDQVTSLEQIKSTLKAQLQGVA